MDIYLIRHTRPDIAPGVCYGRLDVGLPADYAGEASRLPSLLPQAVATVVTSNALRCRRLADFLAAPLHAKVTTDDRLRELDFGQWEGHAWSDIPKIQTSVWARDVWNQSAPDGESYSELHARVSAAWESLLLIADEALIVVGHAGPLRALMTIALELPADSFIRFHLDYGGVAKLSDASGGWRLDFANR